MLECNITYIANWIFWTLNGSTCQLQVMPPESYSDFTQEKKKLRIVQHLNYSNHSVHGTGGKLVSN